MQQPTCVIVCLQLIIHFTQVVTRHPGPKWIKVTMPIDWYYILCTVRGRCFFHLYTDLHSKYPAGLDSEPELADLMNEVAAKIPGRWRDVGLQLGLDESVLQGITSINQGDTNLCYINVFTRWKNYSTTHPYTWSAVVQALKAPSVGESRLADMIMNKLTRHPSQ